MNDYVNYQAGTDELVNKLVEEHAGWATAIAKSVARAWNLDWQIDGLDGGAYEALLFCARRYDPSFGVPFRAYARRRIHESSTEEARQSKSWQRGVGANTEADQAAREVSARLFDIFPELREGILPSSNTEEGDTIRSAIRQLLTGATLLHAFRESGAGNPELAIEFKRMLETIAKLEPIHQAIIWAIYWQGQSMRGLAEEWQIDELSIIREHKEVLRFLAVRISGGGITSQTKLKVRRGLRPIALQLRKKKEDPPFARFNTLATAICLLYLAVRLSGFNVA